MPGKPEDDVPLVLRGHSTLRAGDGGGIKHGSGMNRPRADAGASIAQVKSPRVHIEFSTTDGSGPIFVSGAIER